MQSSQLAYGNDLLEKHMAQLNTIAIIAEIFNLRICQNTNFWIWVIQVFVTE